MIAETRWVSLRSTPPTKCLVSAGAISVACRRKRFSIVSGESVVAGVLNGLLSGTPIADTVHFGPAAACLKHSIPGDFSLVVRTDVDLTAQSGFGVKR